MHLPSFIYVVEMITVLGGTANPRVPELKPEQYESPGDSVSSKGAGIPRSPR